MPVQRRTVGLKPLRQFASKRLEANWRNGASTTIRLCKTATVWGSTPGRPQVVNSATIGLEIRTAVLIPSRQFASKR